MKIRGRTIGPGAEPYIIAEIGVNHDGSIACGLELVDAAAEARADAVKLQFFRTDHLLSRAATLAAYQKDAGATDPFEMLRRLELTQDEMESIVTRAHARDLHAIVTVFSVELVKEAEAIAWDGYKTASPDLINRPLLEALAETGKPMIVSTGAATREEIERTNQWLAGGHLAWLQCVSAYPTPEGDAALSGMSALRAITDGVIGYSDHTRALDTGGLAVAAGACILEKHFTHARSAIGPDHAASLEPDQLKEYIRLARRARVMLGATGKNPLAIEGDVRSTARQSLTTTGSLAAGSTIERGDLTVKRPGVGIEPWRLDEIIGRTLARDVAADTPLTVDDLR